jgi:SecD/SecF fusion protein
MSPILTFLFGLLLLVLFGWYFFTDSDRAKRMLGTVLTVLLAAFCLQAVSPPFDKKGEDGTKILSHGKLHLGLDLQGGTSFLIKLDPPVGEDGTRKTITKDMVDEAIEAFRKRVDEFGVSEPIITPQGEERILIQIPGLDPEKIVLAREQLKKVAKLEFHLVHPQSSRLTPAIEAAQEVLPPGYTIQPMETERGGKPVESRLLIKKKADLEGDRVTRAAAYLDSTGWGVSMSFDKVGAQRFGELTKQVFDEHSQMAIVLDGKIISAPGVTHGAIWGGSAQISGGSMSEKEARSLASALQNPLQTPVLVEEERSASSTLGADSIRSGVVAGIGGLVFVMIFVVVYYRFAGLVAVVGLAVNIIVLFGVMAMLNFVLTLPGIAGIVLTIGLAVDANVLIYERLREEMAAGKSLSAAINTAYSKAFSVIFDANATTLITAGILFGLASGPVKGFAVTLIVGIIASVFSAMVVTRMLFAWALKLGMLQKISMLNLIQGRNFDFMGRRRIWISTSVAIIAVSAAMFVVRGEKNFGIDFKGGDLLMLEAKNGEVSEGQVREALKTVKFENGVKIDDAIIQKEATVDKTYITIRSPQNTADIIEEHLFKTMPEAGFSEHKKDHVGTVVGNEMAKSSLIALGLGALGILAFVSLRFEFSFAIGALVAMLHDIVITLGVFAIFGHELTLVMVGAILTIAGYSINDTIVVYDRIREGLKSGRSGSVQSIMNASINETLSRTLLTSGTAFLSVASLYFFGGPVLNDFAFAIMIGIVVGTYSSIFIASPIVLWWSQRGNQNLRSEVQRGEELSLPA